VLNNYVTKTQRLLQNPAAPTSLYSSADITAYINTARGQLAGEAECIRKMGTLSTVAGQQEYELESINLGTPATTGIAGAINVKFIWYALGDGRRYIQMRPWEWFSLYNLNNPVPVGGPPKNWSQFGQGAAYDETGSANGGTFYLSPVPDAVYTLYLDCVCYPQTLVTDSDVEAVPYLWTDAVPWFAAAYGLWASQTAGRSADAERYFNTYSLFVERARKAANSSVGRWQHSQAADPVQAQKMQMATGAQGGR
jgi:hypothetical protein